MTSSHSFIFALTLGLAGIDSLHAGDAFFSADGRTVTYVPTFDTGCLKRINLETKVVEKITVSLPKDEGIVALASGADGEALFTTEKAAWVHDAKGTRKLCDLGAIENSTSLIVAPSKGEHFADYLFVTGSEKDDPNRHLFFYRKPGQKTFKSTFCRRVQTIYTGAFTADGRFFFDGDGDLWEGGFEPEDEQAEMPPVLNGVRIAPLGLFNTDSANGGSLYVNRILPAGKSIFVVLRGHHMGHLLRVAMNPTSAMKEGSGANDTVQGNYAYMAKSLASVQIIDDSFDPITTAAAISINGTERLLYSKGNTNQTFYLWDSASGKSVEIAKDEEQP
ncbi:MAG: hypothetical protein JNM99_00145 [Verrucomicrobiaceae bacterium]|nr:hypothetical protein [Verrucomicrobiaceae bacterium]